MNDLAIAIRCYNEDNYQEIIESIKLAGFRNVFIEWYNYDYELQNNILKFARKCGLNIIFAHLGYQNSNAIWIDDLSGDEELERYMKDIDICSKNGINLVIIHPTRKYDDPGVTKVGLDRIKRLIKHAEKRKVQVAFENVELKGQLETIAEEIHSDMAGICFDVGHCNLFFDGEFDIEKFKNKILAIHLHDNFKKKDDHNLPFDGTVNWERAIKQILSLNYHGYITIEAGKTEYYADLSFQEYYSLAYERGQKLIELFKKYEND